MAKVKIGLNRAYLPAELEAIKRYEAGEKHSVSTFIDEDSITAGYGDLDTIGDWEFPLPPNYIKEIYGTNSWRTYLETNRQYRVYEFDVDGTKSLYICNELNNITAGTNVYDYITKMIMTISDFDFTEICKEKGWHNYSPTIYGRIVNSQVPVKSGDIIKTQDLDKYEINMYLYTTTD